MGLTSDPRQLWDKGTCCLKDQVRCPHARCGDTGRDPHARCWDAGKTPTPGAGTRGETPRPGAGTRGAAPTPGGIPPAQRHPVSACQTRGTAGRRVCGWREFRGKGARMTGFSFGGAGTTVPETQLTVAGTSCGRLEVSGCAWTDPAGACGVQGGSPARNTSQGEPADVGTAGGWGGVGRRREHPTGKVLGVLGNAQGVRPFAKALTGVTAISPHTAGPWSGDVIESKAAPSSRDRCSETWVGPQRCPSFKSRRESPCGQPRGGSW